MAIVPTKATSTVYDKKIRQLEALPDPALWMDWMQNLQSEIFVQFLSKAFDIVIGDVRLSGLVTSVNGSNVELSSGELLHKTGLVDNLESPKIFTHDTGNTRFVYAAITTTLITHETDPTIGVSVPGETSVRPGANQYQTSVTFEYELSIPSDTATLEHVEIAQVTGAGGVTLTLPLLSDTLVKLAHTRDADTQIVKNNQVLDPQGTQADVFFVDTDGSNLPVLTGESTPADALNLRIFDINPYDDDHSRSKALITIKWGWQGLIGSFLSGDILRVTGVIAGEDALSVGASDLVGQRLFSPRFTSSDQMYDIIANTATSGGNTDITLDSTYAGESLSSDGVIAVKGDLVEFRFTPYVGATPQVNLKHIRTLDVAFVTAPEYTFEFGLFTSGTSHWKLLVEIRSRKGLDAYSGWFAMPAGTYDPDQLVDNQPTITYASPFEVKLPFIDEDSGTGDPGGLTLATTTGGFTINITGWENTGKADAPAQTAHELAVIWTTLDNVSWTDRASSIYQRTSSRFIQVPTEQIRKWAVGVRPIQNGQVIGASVEKTIVSGGMGIAPNDQVVLNAVEVDLRTYSGTSTGSGPVVLTATPVSPSGSATSVIIDAMAHYLRTHRCVIEDNNGDEFIVNQDNVAVSGGGTTITIDDFIPLGGHANAFTAGAFKINTTESGRLLRIVRNLQVELEAVTFSFDADILKGATVGSPAVFRVAQNTVSGKTQADLITVFENDTVTSSTLDFEIVNSGGALELLFDLFDPGGSPNNEANVRGRFSLIMRPKAVGGVTAQDYARHLFDLRKFA